MPDAKSEQRALCSRKNNKIISRVTAVGVMSSGFHTSTVDGIRFLEGQPLIS